MEFLLVTNLFWYSIKGGFWNVFSWLYQLCVYCFSIDHRFFLGLPTVVDRRNAILISSVNLTIIHHSQCLPPKLNLRIPVSKPLYKFLLRQKDHLLKCLLCQVCCNVHFKLSWVFHSYSSSPRHRTRDQITIHSQHQSIKLIKALVHVFKCFDSQVLHSYRLFDCVFLGIGFLGWSKRFGSYRNILDVSI